MNIVMQCISNNLIWLFVCCNKKYPIVLEKLSTTEIVRDQGVT